ncbi:MAG: division/cell wall cluster transcriptional repressor MraZ [Dehalococcoidia bacterium]
MGFFGYADAKLDDKSRVAIPAKFRHDMGEGPVYLMASEDGCLSIFSEETFEALREEVKGQNSRTSREGRENWRSFWEFTEKVTPDSQGRATIPARLLDKLQIKSPCELVVIGMDEWVEAWEAGAYRTRQEGA